MKKRNKNCVLKCKIWTIVYTNILESIYLRLGLYKTGLSIVWHWKLRVQFKLRVFDVAYIVHELERWRRKVSSYISLMYSLLMYVICIYQEKSFVFFRLTFSIFIYIGSPVRWMLNALKNWIKKFRYGKKNFIENFSLRGRSK